MNKILFNLRMANEMVELMVEVNTICDKFKVCQGDQCVVLPKTELLRVHLLYAKIHEISALLSR